MFVRPVQERIESLDILRGFALFGVLLVNMLDFSGSGLRNETLGMRGTPLDQLMDIGIVYFAVTKFYLLFSLLFGIGFAVQMRRMEASGRAFVGFYLRRLGVLLVIGVLHAVLLWDGDILRLYAIAGFGLLLVRRLPNHILLGMALFITVGGLVFFGSMSDVNAISSSTLSVDTQIFQSADYGALVAYRLNHQTALDIQIPMVLVMFILGLVLGRSGVLEQPALYQPVLRRWWKWALVLGLFGNALLLEGYSVNNLWLVSFGVHIGAPALSFAYMSLVLLNTDKLARLAPVGQMALSNYLTHSIVCTTLFYGYGFGLYDQLAPTVTVILVVVIYATQIVISAWWMARYRFGLAEWVWRSLTYWKLQPIQRDTATAHRVE